MSRRNAIVNIPSCHPIPRNQPPCHACAEATNTRDEVMRMKLAEKELKRLLRPSHSAAMGALEVRCCAVGVAPVVSQFCYGGVMHAPRFLRRQHVAGVYSAISGRPLFVCRQASGCECRTSDQPIWPIRARRRSGGHFLIHPPTCDPPTLVSPPHAAVGTSLPLSHPPLSLTLLSPHPCLTPVALPPTLAFTPRLECQARQMAPSVTALADLVVPKHSHTRVRNSTIAITSTPTHHS